MGYFSGDEGRRRTSYGLGPPTVAGDIVFVGSPDTPIPNQPGVGGFVYALNKRNGRIVGGFETGASVYGGFSVVGNCVYVGSGYRTFIGIEFSKGTKIFGW